MLSFRRKDKKQAPINSFHTIKDENQTKTLKKSHGEDLFSSGMQHYQEQNYTKALLSLEQAATKGHSEAQYYVGLFYQYGYGISVDNQLAMEWYTKAVESGSNSAKNSIGQMYHYGLGVPVDYRRSMEWYMAADSAGDSNAQYNIACLYQQGAGVALDYNKAMEWLLKSANNGNNPAAQSQIGVFYEKGLGVAEPNVFTAIEWYEKSAIQGYITAQYNLAYLYEHDANIKDQSKAADWYYKASKSGDKTAMLAVERLTREGYSPKNDQKKIHEEPSLSKETDSRVIQGAKQLGNQVKRFESLLNDNVGLYKERKEGIISGYKKLESAKDEIMNSLQNPQNNVTKTMSRIFSKRESKNKTIHAVKADDATSQSSTSFHSAYTGPEKNDKESFQYNNDIKNNPKNHRTNMAHIKNGDHTNIISKPDEKDSYDVYSLPMLKPDDIVNHKPDELINTKPDQVDYPENNSQKVNITDISLTKNRIHSRSRENDLNYDSSENDNPENDLNYDSPDDEQEAKTNSNDFITVNI